MGLGRAWSRALTVPACPAAVITTRGEKRPGANTTVGVICSFREAGTWVFVAQENEKRGVWSQSDVSWNACTVLVLLTKTSYLTLLNLS